MTIKTRFNADKTIILPPELCAHWDIADQGATVYAKARQKEIRFYKHQIEQAIIVTNIFQGKLFIPTLLKRKAELHSGHEITITVKDDVLHLKVTDIAPMSASSAKRLLLRKKMQKELSAPLIPWSDALLEDIYHIILLNEWDDEIFDGLQQVPTLLCDVATELHNDEMYQSFYSKRIEQLALVCLFQWKLENEQKG